MITPQDRTAAARKAHATGRVDDAALCGAKRKYPDPRPRLGIAGLAHLTDCESCARIISVDHDAALGVHRTDKARKARHLNALRRKAPAMVEALRELGYTVTEPKCGQHYESDATGVIVKCVLPEGHLLGHNWFEFEETA